MKYIIPLAVLMFACNNSAESNVEATSSIEDTALIELDSSELVIELESDLINENLKNLLEDPLDLVEYKKEWGPSNSGIAGSKEIFDTPDTVGIMYRYMLFHKLRYELPSRPTEAELFSKFIITVFKYGEEVGDFYEENEELMMLACAFDNPTLNELNWIGLGKPQLVEMYDSAQYIVDDNWIYEYDNQVISAHFNQSEEVEWIKYVRLNKTIDLDTDIPDLLINF